VSNARTLPIPVARPAKSVKENANKTFEKSKQIFLPYEQFTLN
jgi:hypothetical protein